MKITFALTPDYRQTQLVQSGKHLPNQVTTDLPLPDLSPDARRIVVLANPDLNEECHLRLPYLGPRHRWDREQTKLWEAPFWPASVEEWNTMLLAYWNGRIAHEEQTGQLLHEELQADIHEMERDLEAQEPKYYHQERINPLYEILGEEYHHAQALLDQLHARYNETQAERKRLREEKEQAAQQTARAERLHLEKEKAAWITAYGSTMLQRKVAAGYNCQRAYVLERAGQEYPDYTVDFNETAKWEKRPCPGDAAFEEAQRVGGEVVYLTSLASNSFPDADDEDIDDDVDDDEDHGYLGFEPCETVVKTSYLGKYTLVRQ